MPRPVKHFFEFGSFRLDADKHRLLRDGEVVHLPPKTIEALWVLVQNPGKLLEREELMQAVWADTFVEDANLTVAISNLRKALGQNGDSAEYIETVPRVGYRFVANVREIREESAPLIIEKRTLSCTVIEEEEIQPEASKDVAVSIPITQELSSSRTSTLRNRPFLALAGVTVIAGAIGVFAWTMRAARGTAPDHNVGSIAVLPFKVLGPAGHGPHEGTGLADVLITRLSNLRKVKVRPTSAVQGFNNMGEDSMTFGKRLNVDAVLEGTIYRTNDKVRVTSRLIKVADGTTLWTGQFEKPMRDELRIHNEITAQVVETLASNVSANEKHALAKTFTENPEAYQLYLKGRFEWNKRSWSATTEAERMFRNAIEQDPNLALAYVGLADALMFNSKGTYPAMVAVQKALELDENLAEANATLGFLHLFHGWNWQEAENSFKRAIELNPNYGPAHHWYAQLLAIQGKNGEAKSEMQRALEINPLSHNYLSDLGQIYYFNREYREAEEYCRKALEIYPDFIFAHRCLYDIYLRTGDYERAVEAITLADRVNHSFANEPTAHQKNLEATVEGERKLYREVGIRRFLERRIGKLQDGNVSYEYAALYAFLGEKEEALASLESAFAGHGFLSVFIKADPVFDSLRDDPRYQAIVKNMGLSQF